MTESLNAVCWLFDLASWIQFRFISAMNQTSFKSKQQIKLIRHSDSAFACYTVIIIHSIPHSLLVCWIEIKSIRNSIFNNQTNNWIKRNWNVIFMLVLLYWLSVSGLCIHSVFIMHSDFIHYLCCLRINAESINESTKPQINSLQEIKLKTFSLFQQLIKAALVSFMIDLSALIKKTLLDKVISN